MSNTFKGFKFVLYSININILLYKFGPFILKSASPDMCYISLLFNIYTEVLLTVNVNLMFDKKTRFMLDNITK